jgi:hypothetical protein
VDLNGDGIPEALARIESPFSCGSHGCAAYILDLSGPTARSIGDFIAFSLEVLPTKTGAWRDVSVNGFKQVFQAGKYVSASTAPAAAPIAQDRAKQEGWMSHTGNGAIFVFGRANDGISHFDISCRAGTQGIGFIFGADGIRATPSTRFQTSNSPLFSRFAKYPAAIRNSQYSRIWRAMAILLRGN